MVSVLVGGVPFCCGSKEEGPGEALVEELDQRPHEEGGDQGAHPGQQAGQGSNGYAEQVAADAHKAEGPLALFRDHNGNGVVDGHPQIGGHVQGGGKAHHQHAHGQKDNPSYQPGLRPQAVDGPHRKVHNVAGEEHVHQSGYPHVTAGDKQVHHQHDAAEHHIIDPVGGEIRKKAAPHPLGKALKGVHSKAGALEKAHS